MTAHSRESVWVAVGAIATAVSALAAVALFFIPAAVSQHQSSSDGKALADSTATASPIASPAPSPGAGGAGTATEQGATASGGPRDAQGFNSAERKLVSMLRREVFTNCLPATSFEDGAQIAALNCFPKAKGPDKDPLVILFSSPQAMKDQMSGLRDHDVSGSCAKGEAYSGTWQQGTTILGDLLCDRDGTYYRLTWTYFQQGLEFVAEADDPNALVEWWKVASARALI